MQQLSHPPGSDATPHGQLHRLFFALWPDRAVRHWIADTTAQMVSTHAIRARRVPPERYHLTLQFLGDFAPRPQTIIDKAIAAGESVRSPAFELELDRSGCFGGGRVGWLGPTGMPAGLEQLWSALGLALSALHVPTRSEATFTPHVTVLRGMRPPLPAGAIGPFAWPVAAFAFIESQPGRGTYTILHRWSLSR
jgi:2'-5' RNA ligase